MTIVEGLPILGLSNVRFHAHTYLLMQSINLIPNLIDRKNNSILKGISAHVPDLNLNGARPIQLRNTDYKLEKI